MPKWLPAPTRARYGIYHYSTSRRGPNHNEVTGYVLPQGIPQTLGCLIADFPYALPQVPVFERDGYAVRVVDVTLLNVVCNDVETVPKTRSQIVV